MAYVKRVARADEVARRAEAKVEPDVLLAATQLLRDRLAHRLEHRVAVRHERLRLAVELAVLRLAQAEARAAKQAPELDELVVGHVEQILDVDVRRVLVPRARHVVLVVRVEDSVRAAVRVRDAEDLRVLDLERGLEPRTVVVWSLNEWLPPGEGVGAEEPRPAGATRLPKQPALCIFVPSARPSLWRIIVERTLSFRSCTGVSRQSWMFEFSARSMCSWRSGGGTHATAAPSVMGGTRRILPVILAIVSALIKASLRVVDPVSALPGRRRCSALTSGCGSPSARGTRGTARWDRGSLEPASLPE